MENTKPLETRTLEPTEPTLSFPPFRRRPLRSRTYHTLMQILSYCRTECPQSHSGNNDAELRQAFEGGSSGVEYGQMIEGNGNCDQMKSLDDSDTRPIYKTLEDAVVQETDIQKSKESTGRQNGGFEVKQITPPELDQINSPMNREEEVAQESSISFEEFLMVDNRADDCAVQIVKEQKDAHNDLNFQVDDFSSMGQLELDKELSVHGLCEVLNSFFGQDIDVESSEVGENSKDVGAALSENLLKDSEHQLQLKEIELEKLISIPCVTNSFGCVAGDQEIEEGEISGNAGVADDLLNDLSEGSSSLGDEPTGLVHSYEDNVHKQLFSSNDGERGQWRRGMSNNDCNFDKPELGASAMGMQDSDSQNVLCDRDKETSRSNHAAHCLEKLSVSGRNLRENDAGNQVAVVTIQDDDVSKKKRKRGPLTKERKAKKKRKEKIRRAENDKKLGIKRLKLQTVLKPKPKICRHYLQGRCHEGEKCKFSHDGVPVTKSRPCGFFARQSCMKGDNCPFDHDLSKYPCNNYATKGFCSRGSDCLFSHEIPDNEKSSITPGVSKPEMKSQQQKMLENKEAFVIPDVSQPYVKLASPLLNSNSSKSVDNHGIFDQKGGWNSSNKKVEQVSEPIRTPRKAPKGVSFILHEGMSIGEPDKLKRDGSSLKAVGDTNVQTTNSNVPVGINKSNEMSTLEAPRKPRGINFLSFAQKSSLDDASCKTLSNLLSNGYNVKGNSSLLPEGVGFVEANNQQMSQSATNLVQNSGGNSAPRSTLPQLQDSVDAKICNYLKTSSSLSNTSSVVQKSVHSTLAFAAKFEPSIKMDHSYNIGEAGRR